MTREDRLSRTFVHLADTLVADFDVVEVLAHLGERCVEILDAAAAGVLLADDQGVLRLIAATSEAMELVELFQIQYSEGPCFDCFSSGERIQAEDLSAASERWPRFTPIATGAGFQAVHAFPLRLRDRTLGALNLFSTSPGRLNPADVAAAQAFSDVATIAILQQRAAHDAQVLADRLQLALHSRIAIEQAKGVIAERMSVDMDEAFARLRQYARRYQRLLGEVAQEVIDRKIIVSDLVP